jgi:hypothetical protein
MRTKPILYDDNDRVANAPARPAGAPATLAARIGRRILHEALEALPPTIFFFVGFNFVVFTMNLLLADYAVAVSNFMLATVGALVVGKAVLVANAMPLLRLYDRAPLPPDSVQDGLLLGDRICGSLTRALRALFRLGAQSARRFLPIFDDDLLVASLLRGFPVDFRSVPDLCDGNGIQPSFRPGRDPAAVLYFPPVGVAAQPAATHARTLALEPASRRPLCR